MTRCKKEFGDESSRILECERCETHHCAKCLKLENDLYDKMTKRKDIHWYCGSCEPKVLQCIKLEKEIERKLVDFMGKVDYKIKTLEGSVYKKIAEMEEEISVRFRDYINERLNHHVPHTVQ